MAKNPYDTIDCHFCNGKGCYCAGKSVKQHDAECVSCDICEGCGQLGVSELNKMAADYKADEQFKRAWKSAMLVLFILNFLLGA